MGVRPVLCVAAKELHVSEHLTVPSSSIVGVVVAFEAGGINGTISAKSSVEGHRTFGVIARRMFGLLVTAVLMAGFGDFIAYMLFSRFGASSPIPAFAGVFIAACAM